MTTDTTSQDDNSLVEIHCPFTGEVIGHSTKQQEAKWAEQQEQVRQRCVAVFSSSPLYQARAAKDPEYWDKFSVGGVR